VPAELASASRVLLLRASGIPTVSAHVNTFSANRTVALILCSDGLTSALMAAAVELTGAVAEFCDDAEKPRDAMQRVRPMFVLVDCDHDAATGEDFLASAAGHGARVYVFGPAPRIVERRDMLQRLQVGSVVLPDDITRLREILSQAPRPSPPRGVTR
jgi:hypothetical protein